MDRIQTISKYLANCYRFLTIRNRSEKEVRDYLAKKQAPDAVIEEVIQKLYEQKFLNDEAFALSWIRSRARSKPRGKQLLIIELKQKGISKEIIEKVLHEEQEDVPDEVTQAKSLIVKRIAKFANAPRHEVYNKIGAFLARKGFSWEVSKRAIDDTLSNGV